MKIGVRAHDFGRREIGELAGLLHDEEYEAAQLALPKAFLGIEGYYCGKAGADPEVF